MRRLKAGRRLIKELNCFQWRIFYRFRSINPSQFIVILTFTVSCVLLIRFCRQKMQRSLYQMKIENDFLKFQFVRREIHGPVKTPRNISLSRDVRLEDFYTLYFMRLLV